MNVLLSTTGYIGPDYYRLREPARAIEEAGLGVQVTIQRGLSTTVRPSPAGGEPEVVDVDAQGADVVVLQLPRTPEMVAVHPHPAGTGGGRGRRDGRPAVGDPVRAPLAPGADQEGQGPPGAGMRPGGRRRTVSTPVLLEEYAARGRGAVVPNAIPRRIAELPPAYERAPETVTVGWTGSVLGHPYDLQEMGSGLQQALDATAGASRFTILGRKNDARERLALSEEPEEVPWIPEVDAYVRALGELFDVGVAPLRDDRFNSAKSWLKVLEFAARGVYVVRSPSAEYERLGLGMRARSPRDWAKFLTTAIRDADRRREQAVRARETVLAAHLTEHTVEGWVAAWERAADIRARDRRKGA
jgi:hypothetical protein